MGFLGMQNGYGYHSFFENEYIFVTHMALLIVSIQSGYNTKSLATRIIAKLPSKVKTIYN
ncbi:6630_t:CDS:2 [Acaulospora morrowiae]|uniref:6630_t:CDS:1 n=1 Tax=Acaulospora morrowiae TaxID=94023 RepID=A0A9N8VQV1_9GLOM|nr:6630_t:CDS:2 [Acaulospora morrowiae]